MVAANESMSVDFDKFDTSETEMAANLAAISPI
jgi:hypothetical protein